jgi:putative iron-dependent peroxidase
MDLRARAMIIARIRSAEFGNLGDEVDPIVGGRDQGHFTVPGLPRGTTISLQRRYTRTVGGGYFFLPGLVALEFLALP